MPTDPPALGDAPESLSARLAALADDEGCNCYGTHRDGECEFVTLVKSDITALASDVADLETRVEGWAHEYDARIKAETERDALSERAEKAEAWRANRKDQSARHEREKAEYGARNRNLKRQVDYLAAEAARLRAALNTIGSYDWEVRNEERSFIAAIVREALLGEGAQDG